METHMEWLVAKSGAEINLRLTDESFKLPGKTLHNGQVLLEIASNKTRLVGSNATLVGNNATLVETNESLVAAFIDKDRKIKLLEEQIKTKNHSEALLLDTPGKIAGSKKKVAVTPVSTKKKKTLTKDHTFEDNEEVTIQRTYSYKPGYAGKRGEVESSGKSKVKVRFDDGTESITLSHANLEHGWV